MYLATVVRRPGKVGSRSLFGTALLLVGIALAIRLGVLATATAFGPADSVGDVVYHARLVDDPVGHLEDSSPSISQYAPYLGVLEWVTTKPWLALGVSVTTALRLSSITWDLVGMCLLLYGTARRFPGSLVFVGLMWAVSPLLWPASAYSAEDEPIATAIVAAAVVLVFARRRCGAIVVRGRPVPGEDPLVAGGRGAPRTAPRGAPCPWATAGWTLLAAGAVTWLLSGTDGLTQQAGYRTDVVGFSISFWSTLVMHRTIAPHYRDSRIARSGVRRALGLCSRLAEAQERRGVGGTSAGGCPLVRDLRTARSFESRVPVHCGPGGHRGLHRVSASRCAALVAGRRVDTLLADQRRLLPVPQGRRSHRLPPSRHRDRRFGRSQGSGSRPHASGPARGRFLFSTVFLVRNDLVGRPCADVDGAAVDTAAGVV